MTTTIGYPQVLRPNFTTPTDARGRRMMGLVCPDPKCKTTNHIPADVFAERGYLECEGCGAVFPHDPNQPAYR